MVIQKVQIIVYIDIVNEILSNRNKNMCSISTTGQHY